MGKKIVLLLAFLLIAMPLMSYNAEAFLSQIKVVTLPNHEVTIKVLVPGDKYYVRNTFENIPTGDEGIVILDYSTGNPEFKIEAYVSKGNTIMFKGNFGPYDEESLIVIGLPEGFEEEQTIPLDNNESEMNNSNGSIQEDLDINVEITNEEVNVVEEASERESITGNVIADLGDVSKLFYYVLAVVILGGLLGFVVGRMIKTRKIKMGIIDASPVKVKENKDLDYNKELLDAERKLNEAQAQLAKLKSKDKVRQAEERLQRDREELEKLRKGEK